MGPGKRARAYSTGYLDKGEMNMMSRPGSRKVMTQEWLTSMRDRGIIISDAELRYRKWLSLSESQKPPLSQARDQTRPQTAPPQITTATVRIGSVRHNRCSVLRHQKLPEVHAQTDFKRLIRNNKYFDRQCRCYTAMDILTENFPEDLTSHQFLTGSRYNHTHHIDSRSLSRLGVYIPRSDVAKTFINPAGIIPSQQGRVGSVITPTEANVTYIPSLMEIQQMKYNRGSISISPVCSSHELDEDEDELDLVVPNKPVLIAGVPTNTPEHHTMKKDGVWEDTYEGDNEMMVTEEAKQLADRIVQESLTSIISEESSHTVTSGLADQQIVGTEECQDEETTQQEIDLTNKSQTENEEVATSNTLTKDKCDDSVTNTFSETSVSKSSSTIFVDMTRLQIQDN